MTDRGSARHLESDRAQLEESAYRSLTAQDFRSSLAPLCRLLLTLEPRDPERAVVLACLAVVYARTGRAVEAERALRNAESVATNARALAAVRLASAELRRR